MKMIDELLQLINDEKLTNMLTNLKPLETYSEQDDD